MTQKKRKNKFFIVMLVLFLLALSTYLFFLNEQTTRERELQKFIKSEFSISKNEYKTDSSFNQFGFMYTLVFKDEPQVEYEFFVKKNKKDKYVISYYGHNSEKSSPLKETLFMTTNNK